MKNILLFFLLLVVSCKKEKEQCVECNETATSVKVLIFASGQQSNMVNDTSITTNTYTACGDEIEEAEEIKTSITTSPGLPNYTGSTFRTTTTTVADCN